MRIIEAPDATLRYWSPDDAGKLAGLLADPSFNWYPYRRQRTKDEGQRIIQAAMRHFDQYQVGRWAVWSNESRDLIGYAGVSDPSWPDITDAWELGFRLAKHYRGRGIAGQVVEAAIRDAFEVSQRDQIVATTETENTSCISLLRRLGFRELYAAAHPDHGAEHKVFAISRH